MAEMITGGKTAVERHEAAFLTEERRSARPYQDYRGQGQNMSLTEAVATLRETMLPVAARREAFVKNDAREVNNAVLGVPSPRTPVQSTFVATDDHFLHRTGPYKKTSTLSRRYSFSVLRRRGISEELRRTKSATDLEDKKLRCIILTSPSGVVNSMEKHRPRTKADQLSVVEREISCNYHAHAFELQSKPRTSSGMGTACSRTSEKGKNVPKPDVSDGEDYYEVRGSSGSILNPEMGWALGTSVEIQRGLVPKSSGCIKEVNGKADKVGAVRVRSAGDVEGAMRRLEQGGRKQGSSMTTRRAKSLRSLPPPTGLGPALARSGSSSSAVLKMKRDLLVSRVPETGQGSSKPQEPMQSPVDHVSIDGLITARSLESIFVERENDVALAMAEDGQVQRPTSLPPGRPEASETTAKAQQDGVVQPDNGDDNDGAAPVIMNAENATDAFDVDPPGMTAAVLDPNISPIGLFNDSFDSRYSSTDSTKSSHALGAVPPSSASSSADAAGTYSARAVAKKNGGSDERRKRSATKTSRRRGVSRGRVAVSAKAPEAEPPSEHPPRSEPSTRSQPLPRRRSKRLSASSSGKSIYYGAEAGAEWHRPRLASVPPRPPVAPESPFIVQSSGSSMSSDTATSTTARPVWVAAAAVPASVVDNESWIKALKWRSQSPAPPIVSKLPSASTAAVARSKLHRVRLSSSIRAAPETTRTRMAVTMLAESSGRLVSTASQGESNLSAKTEMNVAAKTAAASTVSSEDDSAFGSRRHGMETGTMLRRKNTLGMVEDSQMELLPRPRSCASPETAPETPRVNPSMYETAAKVEAAVALTPAPPETSVPEGSALESSPPGASPSSHDPGAVVLMRGDEADDLVLGYLDDIPFETLASSAAAELEAAEIAAEAAKVEAEAAATEAAAAAAAAAAAEQAVVGTGDVPLEGAVFTPRSTLSAPVSTSPKPSFSTAAASVTGRDGGTRATDAAADKIMTPLHRRALSEPKIILPPRSSTRRQKARRSSSAVDPRVLGGVSLSSSRHSSNGRRVRGVRIRAQPACLTPSARSRRSRGSKPPENGDFVVATLTAAAAAVAGVSSRVEAADHRGGGKEAGVLSGDGVKAEAGLEADVITVVGPERAIDETQVVIAGKGVTEDAHRMPPSFEFVSKASSGSLPTPGPVAKGVVAPPSVLPSAAADPVSLAVEEGPVATVAFGTVEIEVVRGMNAPSEDTCAGSHLSSSPATNDADAFFGDVAAEHLIAAADARWWDTAAAGSEIGIGESSAIVGGSATEALSPAVEASEAERSPALYGSVAWAMEGREELAIERTEEGEEEEEEEEESQMQSQNQMEASSSVALRGVGGGRGKRRGGMAGGKGRGGGGGMYTMQTPPPFHGESGGHETAAGAADDSFALCSDSEFDSDSPAGVPPSQAQTVDVEVEEEDSLQQRQLEQLEELEQLERNESDFAIDIAAIEEADKVEDVSGFADGLVGHGDEAEAVVETRELLSPFLSLGSSAIAAVMEWGGMGTDGGIVKGSLAAVEGAGAGAGEELGEEEQQLSAVEAFGCQCTDGVRSVVEMLGSVESVATAMLVSTTWRDAVRPDADRLYKVVVRRAGVTPRRRAAFWEYLVLHRPPRPRPQAHFSSSTSSPTDMPQLSLAELSRQGMNSRWSKAIDADVERTFGRPTSRREIFRLGAGKGSRQRHWWPESLGGAPLGARTPAVSLSPENSVDGGDLTDDDGVAYNEACLRPSSSPAGETIGISDSDLAAAEAAAAHGAAAAAAVAASSVTGNGLLGKEACITRMSTFSTAAMSNSTTSIGMYCSVGQRSSSPLSCRVCSTTLSPLGSPGSDRRQPGEGKGEEGGGGVRKPGSREGLPSPRTLQELERVKGQLTDTLRALAVSFGQVGYCQGLDYVVAHLIKCLGTDAHRGFSSDPERVFAVLIGLFRDYGLQHIYSEDLEALQQMLGVLNLLIEDHLPRLHRHFQEQDVDVAFFAVGWFQTLFLYMSKMPHDTLLWIWDVWITEQSYKIFFRATLGILAFLEQRLLALDLEAIMTHLGRFPDGSADAMEMPTLMRMAISFKVTDSILREKLRQLDLDKKKAANDLEWTRSRPSPEARITAPTSTCSPASTSTRPFGSRPPPSPSPPPRARPFGSRPPPSPSPPPRPFRPSVVSSLSREAFPTEVIVKNAVVGGAGSENGGYSVGVTLPRDGPSSSSFSSLSSSWSSHAPVIKGGHRGRALGKRGKDVKAGGGGESYDAFDDGQSELATVNRLVYSEEKLEAAMAIAHAAPAKARGRQSDNPIKSVSRGERASRRVPNGRCTPPGRSSGVTVAGAQGVASIFASAGNCTSGFRSAIKSEAGGTGRPGARVLEVPPMPLSLFGVANSLGRPVRESKTETEMGVKEKRVETADGRTKRASAPNQEPDSFLPPEMKPLARAVRADVSASKSQEWSFRRSRGSTSSAGSRGDGSRLLSAPGGILPPGVLPPGVKLEGVSLPEKPAKLGGKDEYAFFAAGDE